MLLQVLSNCKHIGTAVLAWPLSKQHVLWLQGLDGEATERMIEHLAEPASEQQEAEEEYAVARVLADQAASGASLLPSLTLNSPPETS